MAQNSHFPNVCNYSSTLKYNIAYWCVKSIFSGFAIAIVLYLLSFAFHLIGPPSNTFQLNSALSIITISYHIPSSIIKSHKILSITIQCHLIPSDTNQYNQLPSNTVQYHIIQLIAIQYNPKPYITIRYHTIPKLS